MLYTEVELRKILREISRPDVCEVFIQVNKILIRTTKESVMHAMTGARDCSFFVVYEKKKSTQHENRVLGVESHWHHLFVIGEVRP